jgi:crotonobetainyl-CoA:carnitine CoA-transferase CaiB-like acyl-CoA transferase
MVGANNNREHTRLFEALGQPSMGNKTYEYRAKHRKEEVAFLSEALKSKTAQEWEDYLQSRHVPAARQRTVAEALADPQIKHRGVFHRHESVPGIDGPCTVPVAAFKFAKDGPRVDTVPARMGAHNEEVLGELGYSADEIDSFKNAKAI